MRSNWVARRVPGSREGQGVSGRDKESRYGQQKKESHRGKKNVEKKKEERKKNETVSHPHNHNG